MGDLTGRVVVVSGAAGGIGRSASARLLLDGAKVAALDLRPDAAPPAGSDPRNYVAVPTDVTDEGAVVAAIAKVEAALGPIDGLFANAGIGIAGALHETSLADWQRTINVNLTGVFLSIKHVLPSMMAAGRGAIVTTGSVSSVIASPGGSASYKASKGGVNLLTKSVAVEYAECGIRANCVCPGSVDTGFGSHSPSSPGGLSPVVARTPLRRKAAPDEIASIVSFLLSDESSYVTGATIMADGGFTAG